MTAGELLGAMLLLERRVPDRHVTVDRAMAVAWLPDFKNHPAEAAIRAAEKWAGDKFPSANQFVTATAAEARLMLDEEIRKHSAGELELTACPYRCSSSGWVATGDGSMPCQRCSPLARWRWETCWSRPSHDGADCQTCAALRRGEDVEGLEEARIAQRRADARKTRA